ncbi:hypothetical protein M8J76_008243 [Diaphorina citri]|nr:hypothetical protein M8J75_007766 [Diaphorina citri]KAI5722433.1 hypothetical protein M8J76_008243 [Diaphorina citri]
MESDNVLEEPKKILCVGLVCVDLIQICESFPKEDSDQRCLEQRWQRGGNASNNCTVLSQLGAPCEFFGTVSKGVFADYVECDFRDLNISCDNCIVHEGL